jgi:hypothetical protein
VRIPHQFSSRPSYFPSAGITVASAIVLGVVDQFTGKIVPQSPSASRISEAHPGSRSFSCRRPMSRPGSACPRSTPRFQVGYESRRAHRAPGTGHFIAFGGRASQELIDVRKIDRVKDAWRVDASARNWADAARTNP